MQTKLFNQYKKDLIAMSADFCCPVMKTVLDYRDGEVLMTRDAGHIFVSSEGVKKLREKFGDAKIDRMIITPDKFAA